ncbi:MAG: hypothetical protein JWR12_2335 [Mucilaginibacter sp.]|nr:hypothetical protein [Mucilaginibacter sp.]
MNIRCSVFLFIVGLAGFASCKNNDEVIAKPVSTFVNFVNASADTLNFFVNGTRKNTSTIYPGRQSLYLPVPDGQQNYELKKVGNSVFLFSLPLTIADSAYTSIYVYGETASQLFTTADLLLKYKLSPDTTQIRFVNVSPDAGNLTITVGDTIRFVSQAFKTSTAFALTGSGRKTVKVFRTGVATPLQDTAIIFQRGGIYTLISKGLINGKGNAAFGVGVVFNANTAN